MERSSGSTDRSSSGNEAKLCSKLRAVEFEIDAVASTVKPTNEDGDGSEQCRAEDGARDSGGELDLQHALAADRLRSLKKTRALIEKELSVLRKGRPSKGVDHDKLRSSIIKEEARPKRKGGRVRTTGKSSKKRFKTVSFDDDADFDAVLDAASTGFVETVS